MPSALVNWIPGTAVHWIFEGKGGIDGDVPITAVTVCGLQTDISES